MRYSGSKAKIAKYIIPFIMEELKEGYTYVEPFMGGCNMLSEVDWPNKVGADSNRYVVALWNNLKIGSIHSIPRDITEKQYNEMKELAKKGSCSVQYPAWLIGYAGTACSYGSAWFNGYAHINEKRGENHILEAAHGLAKHLRDFKHLNKTWFHRWDYKELFDFYYYSFALSNGSNKYVFYCDPPYENTKGYKDKSFNHEEFWGYVRKMSKAGFKVLVSEYNAPDDFKCIWSAEKKDGMGTTKFGCKQNIKVEKLFVYNEEYSKEVF